MSNRYRGIVHEEEPAVHTERIAKDSLDKTTDAWQKISALLPEFWFYALNMTIHDQITAHTDPVLFARSTEELLLYIELTGHVPADPDIFFDFGGAE